MPPLVVLYISLSPNEASFDYSPPLPMAFHPLPTTGHLAYRRADTASWHHLSAHHQMRQPAFHLDHPGSFSIPHVLLVPNPIR